MRTFPKCLASLALLVVIVPVLIATSGDERFAIPQANLNYLSIFVADARGFFRDEGLENETIIIPGTTAIADFFARCGLRLTRRPNPLNRS